MTSDRQSRGQITSTTSGQTESTSAAVPDGFIARSIAVEEFGEYMADSDTDTENSTAPPGRRWVWLCKLPQCTKNGAAWTCKSNWLLHLYETPAHRQDPTTRTREGRRSLSRRWREERAYDLSDVKISGDTTGIEQSDKSEIEGQPDRA